MKNGKASRAIGYLDDDIIASAAKGRRAAKQKPHIPWQRFMAVAAIFIVALTGVIYMIPPVQTEQNSIVALDVNPSLELEVTPAGKVDEIIAHNGDAEIIIGDMDFEGVDLDVAINALIGSMLGHGYITADKNSILISVDSEDAKRGEELCESVKTNISLLLSGGNIEASVMTQSFERGEGGSEGVSPAKAALIKKIVAAGLTHKDGTPYTYEGLSSFSVHELRQILETKKVAVEGMTSSGCVGIGELVGTEAALTAAYNKAGVSPDGVFDISVELDFDDDLGIMIYEVEFECSENEYEYEINAKTGEILKEEIEPTEDDDLDDDDDNDFDDDDDDFDDD